MQPFIFTLIEKSVWCLYSLLFLLEHQGCGNSNLVALSKTGENSTGFALHQSANWSFHKHLTSKQRKQHISYLQLFSTAHKGATIVLPGPLRAECVDPESSFWEE